jgi:sulfopyruvate decarboxylase TPP-binding subunit
MFTGEQVGTLLSTHGFTHVVTLPDSTIGRWEQGIERAGIKLVRVCREGEAWTIAGGLHLGGATPLVMIQCTGLSESGDALRNMIHDWKFPIYSMVGLPQLPEPGQPAGRHVPGVHGADPRRVEVGRVLREAAGPACRNG